MNTYAVQIEAIVRKTYKVKAKNAESAVIIANELFCTKPEHDVDEDYSQDVVSVERVKGRWTK